MGGSARKRPEDFVTIAKTLDLAAKEVGVNFIGGYSALVSKGMTRADTVSYTHLEATQVEVMKYATQFEDKSKEGVSV